MTLAELYALDPLALWAALPSKHKADVITSLLTSVFAEVCAECDGTDCSSADRDVAARIVQDSHQGIYDALNAAFPEILGDDLTALHSFSADMLGDAGKILVKGVRGKRVLHKTTRYSEAVKIGGRKVEIAGFKNIGTEDEPVWEAWTQAQVDDERVRRHPDQFVGPRLPAFVSILAPAEPYPTSHHEDHSYDRAA